jgi:hypothetical protein
MKDAIRNAHAYAAGVSIRLRRGRQHQIRFRSTLEETGELVHKQTRLLGLEWTPTTVLPAGFRMNQVLR